MDFVEFGLVKDYLIMNKVLWIFNFFYVFYFGGVWECMIGLVWCILDVFFLENKLFDLIYEVLLILMVEVCIIVNSRLFVLVFLDLEVLVVFLLILILM